MAVAERLLQNGLLDLRSDKSLVRAAQSGRSDAYAALVSRYYPKVYSFVSHLLSSYRHRASAPGAEDLTQEVFTRALNALSRFNGDYRVGPWLLRIARNLCVDETRRDSHRPQPADPIELPNMETSEGVQDDVWESVSKSEVVDVVRKALSRLPIRQRTVLILKEMEGWSYADIAPVVGTNVRGVEATLRRARARFRLEATNFDTQENERATCRRVTHLAASDPNRFTQTELSHIDRCDQCRRRTARIRSAEKLFGFLPHSGGAGLSIRSIFDAFRSHPRRARVRKSLFSREGIRTVITSPVVHVAEAATVLMVAAAVAVSASPAIPSRSVAANAPSLSITTPVFAAPVQGAVSIDEGVWASTISGPPTSSSARAQVVETDFSKKSLIERVLPIELLDPRSQSLLATTSKILDVDSWEATDAVFTELESVASEVNELNGGLDVENFTDRRAVSLGESLLEPLTVNSSEVISRARSRLT